MKKNLIIALGTLLLTACYKDNKEDLYQNIEAGCQCDTTGTVSYSADISPVLTANCALSGCHAGSSPQSGIDLSNYEDVRTVACAGLLENVLTGSPGPQMPPPGYPELSEAEIDRILSWAESGACNN